MSNRSSDQGSGGTRRDRREAARRDARLKAAATSQPEPFWKSPIFLMTVGALAVAAVIIGFVVLSNNKGGGGGGSATIDAPLAYTPTEGANGNKIGPDSAPVKVAIWSDFQCPACDAFAKSTLIDLVKKYAGTGDVQFSDHALWFIGAGQNEDSLNAGAAAECAAEQNLYWPYHDYLFANQGAENAGWPTRALLDGIAAKVGADAAKFTACYDGGTGHTTIKDNTALAEKVPVSGTPTVQINGVPYESRYVPTADQLSVEIDKAIAAAKGGASSPAPAATATPSP